MAALRQPSCAPSALTTPSPAIPPTQIPLRFQGLRILTCPVHCSSSSSKSAQTKARSSSRAAIGTPGSPSSPSSRNSSLPWRELTEYAWVYGPATGSSFSPSIQPADGQYSAHGSSTCTHSSQTVSDLAEEGMAETVKVSEPALPPITLSALIRDSFKEAQVNCTAQMARLGKDPDSEVVHDLRVVLRRLRNMLNLFYPFLHVSKDLDPKQVSNLLRALGAVRDSGAMMDTLDKLETRMGAELAQAVEEAGGAGHNWSEGVPAETGSMAAVLEAARMELRALEQKQLVEACSELRSRQGRRLFSSLEAWAEHPSLGLTHVTVSKGGKGGKGGKGAYVTAHEAATLASPLSGVSASILSPYVSSLLLHPAWHLEDIWEGTSSTSAGHLFEDHATELAAAWASSVGGESGGGNGGLYGKALPKPDEHLCECAHDLRKHLRELRYAMELMAPGYMVLGDVEEGTGERAQVLGKQYKEALVRVKELQGVLGDLQDLQVLAAFLAGYGEEQEKQRKRKGKKGKRKGTRDDVVGMCLVKLQDVLLQMQKEVWNSWLDEREKINSERGRYKLFKATLRKPHQQADTPVLVSEAEMPSPQSVNSPIISPLALARQHSSPAATSAVLGIEERKVGAVAAMSGTESDSEQSADDDDLDSFPDSPSLHLSQPVATGTSCRLWSNRSSERDEWRQSEELPKDMLADVLAEIAMVEPSKQVVKEGARRLSSPRSPLQRQGHRVDSLAVCAHDDGMKARANSDSADFP